MPQAIGTKHQRPSFEEIYMRLALDLSKRSTCNRKSVGCVITSADFRRVLSIGYNGNATGFPNACDSSVPGSCGCLHAEDNAVINFDSPRETPKIVFVTLSPCTMCAKRLINLGNVQKLYYSEKYRDKSGLKILEQANIPTEFLPIDI